MEAPPKAKPCLLVLTSTWPRSTDDTSPRFVFDLTYRLRTEFRIIVLAPHGPGLRRQELFDGVEVLRFRYLPERLERLAYGGGMPDRLRANRLNYLAIPFFILAQIVATRRLLVQRCPDVIHAHWWIPQAFSALIAGYISRRRPPVVCTLHGGDVYAVGGRLTGPMIRRLRSWILGKCARVCPVSRAVADELGSRITQSRKTVVAPMGVEMTRLFRPMVGAERNRTSILYVGRLAAKKGVDWLLNAFASALDQEPDLTLTIVGGGPEAWSLRQLADDLDLGSRVNFLGALPHDRLPKLFNSSGMTVVPSVQAPGGDREGLGLTAVEALACGCPVIGSDTPSLRDVISPGRNGLVVPQGDVAALSDALVRLATDVELWENLRRNASVSVERFAWENVSNRYLALFRDCLSTQDC